jgi:hypothetical protein
MGVEVKSGGEGVIVAAVTSRMDNRKSSALLKTQLKTRRLLVSTE